LTPIDLWFGLLFSQDIEGTKLDLNPNDPGNYTPDGRLLGSQCGISAKEFPDAPFGHITPSYAARLAKAKYWDAHGLDNFPPAISILLADSYYNGGEPIQWLQRAVGTPVDGRWGPNSQSALRVAWAQGPLPVLVVYTSCRIKYLAGLNRPDMMEGWAKRCMMMLCLAIQVVGGLPAVTLTKGTSV
jgi:lysozyme family protein